ncbi:MAG: phosphatidylserine decarboxylase [Oligoflexia bacterium]|nr:phosphatidylserine decarboxylase [Oligoflexia bacterium]
MKKSDFDLMEKPLRHYENLQTFFTRKIKMSSRPLSNSMIVSPCDGIITGHGNISGGTLIQAKNISYTLDALITERGISEQYKNGSYFNLYLSPRNYHRFHSPLEGTISAVKHVRGAFFPVNRWGQQIEGLFTKNERYIVTMSGDRINICLAIIGACGVGSIKIHHAEGKRLGKGEELGMFKLGSTIVLITDKSIPSEESLIQCPCPVNVNAELLLHR